MIKKPSSPGSTAWRTQPCERESGEFIKLMIGQISLYLPKYLASKIPHLVRYLNWLNQLSSSNSNIQVMILEKSGDGWWRGQYGNKVAFHLLSNLEIGTIPRSGGFHPITHKRRLTTRTPTVWLRTSSTSWWNFTFSINCSSLQLSQLSWLKWTNNCPSVGGAVCIQGPGRHWIELQQRRSSWGNESSSLLRLDQSMGLW